MHLMREVPSIPSLKMVAKELVMKLVKIRLDLGYFVEKNLKAYQVGDTFSKRGAVIPKKKSDTSHSAKKPGPGVPILLTKTYNIGGEIASPERGVKFTKGKRSFDNTMPTPGP